MKIIVSLLFLIIATINASSELFLNFVPYSDSKCTNPSGVGYSGIIDTCMSFDLETYFMFKYSDNSIGLEKYQSRNGFECESGELTYNFTSDISSSNNNAVCVEHYKVGRLNIINQRKQFGGYFKIFTSTSFPVIPKNSIVNSFMPNECTSDSSNTLLVQYLINGTTLLGNPIFGKSNLLLANKLGYHTSGSSGNSGYDSAATPTGSGSGTGSGSFSGSNSVAPSIDEVTFYCTKNGIPMSISTQTNSPNTITIKCESAAPFYNSTLPSSSSSSSSSSLASASSSGFNLYNNIKLSNFYYNSDAFENVYCN